MARHKFSQLKALPAFTQAFTQDWVVDQYQHNERPRSPFEDERHIFPNDADREESAMLQLWRWLYIHDKGYQSRSTSDGSRILAVGANKNNVPALQLLEKPIGKEGPSSALEPEDRIEDGHEGRTPADAVSDQVPVIQREEGENGPQQDQTNNRHSATVSEISDGTVYTGSFHSAADRSPDHEIEGMPLPAVQEPIDLTGGEDQVIPSEHRKKRRLRGLSDEIEGDPAGSSRKRRRRERSPSVIAIEAPQPRTKFERRLALKQAAIKMSETKAQEHAAMERLIASKARLQGAVNQMMLMKISHPELLENFTAPS